MLTSKRLFWCGVALLMAVPIAALLFGGPSGIDRHSLTQGVIVAAVGTVAYALFFGKRE